MGRKIIAGIFNRVVFPIICLFLAIACGVFGAPWGGIAFVVLGMLFEGLFWVSLLGKKKAIKA